jgi:hypothetical protein
VVERMRRRAWASTALFFAADTSVFFFMGAIVNYSSGAAMPFCARAASNIANHGLFAMYKERRNMYIS